METTIHSSVDRPVALRTFSDAVIEYDDAGRISEWNEEAQTLLGWKRDDALGRSFFDLCLSPEFRVMVQNHLREMVQLKSGNLVGEELELKALRQDGNPFDAEMTVLPIRSDGGLKFKATLHDISEQKRDEMVRSGQKKIFEMLTSGGSLREILAAVIHVIEERFNVRCSVLLMGEDKKHLRFGSAPSLPNQFNEAVDGLEIGPCSGSCGTAAYRCDTVVIEDIKTDPLWAGFRELGLQSGIRACWSKPIRSERGDVLGTLCMYYADARKPRAEEIELMETSANLASIAIERGKAINELENKGKEVEHLKDLVLTRDERIQDLKDEIEQLRAKLADKSIH